MSRLWLTAVLAVPLLCINTTNESRANPGNPPDPRGFGCADCCFRLFPHIHQHGPLFNYGPYYGYYPFKPYGPWDAYLRYDPYFYGDPYAAWGSNPVRGGGGDGYGKHKNDSGWYGRNPHLHSVPHIGLFHKHGCLSCGFWHASWLHGGWFRGHTWLHGSPLAKHHGHHGHKSGCSSCGGDAPAYPETATVRLSGFGTPAQSSVYYPTTPALDPTAELITIPAPAR